MTAIPDPKTVREIAQTAGRLIVESLVGDHIVHKAMAQHFIGHDNVYAWSETYDRVLDELAAVLKPLTWPAEQPQDDGDVRAVRGLTQAASRMLGTWAEANEAVRRELWTTLHDRADDVFDRFRERYAALDAKAPRERVAAPAEHAEEER